MSGWYVFGVADSGLAVEREGLQLVRDGQLAAVVAPVDPDEFTEEQLNDRPWLEAKVLAHESVLSRYLRDGPVVPLRFGAVYRRLDDVVELLDERRAELTEDLERVRGRVELGVKGWVDRTRLEETLAQKRSAGPARSPGRAYLERKQVERDLAAEASGLLAEIARAAHSRLMELAVAAVVNRPQSPELTGRAEPMFLNTAYLVSADDVALRGEVDALNEQHRELGVSFETTGPWPPYNFVGREEA